MAFQPEPAGRWLTGVWERDASAVPPDSALPSRAPHLPDSAVPPRPFPSFPASRLLGDVRVRGILAFVPCERQGKEGAS